VYARAQIQKVPGNYNWNTKGVQIKKKKKSVKKNMGPSPGTLPPEPHLV
jgi:hypothetical protein